MRTRAWYIGLSVNVLLALTLISGGAWYFTRPTVAETPVRTPTKTATVAKPVVQAPKITVADIIKLTNDYRATKGLQPLIENPLLDESACAKAQHMIDNKYWAHVSPDGIQPWYFFEQAGYVYDKAGENLAHGYSTSYVIVDGWIHSPTHEENLVGPYNETGICIKTDIAYQYKKSTTLVVAHYGTPY